MSLRSERRLRAEPARRDAGARAPARDRQTRSCSTRELEQLRQVDSASSRRARSTSRGRSPTARPGWSTALERALPRGRRGARRAASTSWSSPTAAVGPERARDPVAARGRRPCTTTSSARARACRPGSCVESGEPREVHTSRRSSATAPRAVNPYLMLETLGELVEPSGCRHGVDDAEEARSGASSRASPRAC